MSAIGRHKHRLPWLLLWALAAIVEWAAQQVKAWAGNKITAPAPEPAPAPTGGETTETQ